MTGKHDISCCFFCQTPGTVPTVWPDTRDCPRCLVLRVPHDLEALERVRVVFADAALLAGDVDLLVDCVDAVEVGEEKAAAAAVADDDAVAFYVEFVR